MSNSISRVQLQPAWVLHQRPFRDTSAIVDILTLEHGRLSLIARGVRGQKSSRRGLLVPFCPLLISWSGRGELPSMGAIESCGAPHRLTGEALFCAMYVNELLTRLLPRRIGHAQLFAQYQSVLQSLTAVPLNSRGLRLFEKILLDEIGYGLMLDQEADNGAAIVAENHYRYIANHGPIPVSDDRVQADVIQGATLLSLASDDLSDLRSLRESKHLMRNVLDHYLGDRPLNSRALFRSKSVSHGPS